MTTRNYRIRRWLICFPAAFLGIACLCQTSAAPAAVTQIVVVAGDGEDGTREPAASSPESGSIPTSTVSGPTPTPTVAQVTMTAGQELSCVAGPHWILYEWVAKILDGETVVLLARSEPAWPDYYYARKADGTECWAFGGSSTIHGDPSTLPVREAPPLPEVTYAIENGTGLRVTTVYIRGKDETAWGANRLGGDLLPGATFNLSLTAGFYDVQIVDYNGGVLYEKHDIAIGSEPDSRYTLLNNMIRFQLHNIYSESICRMTVRPAGGTYSEYTIPDDGRIAPGERIWMMLLAGRYDISLFGCGGIDFFVGMGNKYVGPAMDSLP